MEQLDKKTKSWFNLHYVVYYTNPSFCVEYYKVITLCFYYMEEIFL